MISNDRDQLKNAIEYLLKPIEKRTDKENNAIVVPLLKELSFFIDRHSMSKRDMCEMSNHLKYEFVEAGDTIFKQGDPGD